MAIWSFLGLSEVNWSYLELSGALQGYLGLSEGPRTKKARPNQNRPDKPRTGQKMLLQNRSHQATAVQTKLITEVRTDAEK